MKQILQLLAAISFLFFIFSCAKSSSSAIGSSEIYGSFSVTGNSADKLTCKATFRVGGALGTYVELDGDDKAVCSDGTAEVPLAKTTDFLGVVEYSSTGLIYNTSKTYSITFKRKGNESHMATGTLPTLVTIGAPAAGSSQTKGQVLPFTFTAATSNGISVSLNWSTSVKSATVGHNLTENGTDTFSAEEMTTKNSEGQNLTGNISATMKIERFTNGTFPSTIKGGSMQAIQQATRALTLVD